ncbi:MAG: AMP-binding protein, partial [Pseudomonadota bacterium]
PDKAALRFKGQAWSYAELKSWVDDLASGLSSTIARGDRIAFLGHNCAAEIALFFAAAKIGAIVVPLNWRLATDELRFIVEDAGAALLIYGDECAATANAIPDVARLSADEMTRLSGSAPAATGALQDPLLIVYTSGTTGRPKGAVLTQEAVFWNALNSLHAHDLTAMDHVLNVLPLFHVGGINIQVMPCFFVGGTVTLHAVFDPKATLKALETDGITSTVCVPTMMQALLSEPAWKTAQLPALRLMTIGSTDVPVDILQVVHDRGVPMIQVYGSTETGPIASYQRAIEAKSTTGSIGRAAAHLQLSVRDGSGRECAVDEPGELWVKGPNLFREYWNNHKATRAAMQDGWFKTGDVARQDRNGLYWFVSRLKHVIISGGENIYPAEIERLLARLPGVAEVAVVGRPDPIWGEVPVAVAVLHPGGPTKQAILEACEGQIARFKQPKDVVLLDALPKNALGKVLVDEVRALAAGRTPSGVT